jgi:hypothetical protein
LRFHRRQRSLRRLLVATRELRHRGAVRRN